MVKKLLLFLMLMAVLLPAAALADKQVIDDAGVIDAETEAEITRVIDRIEQEYQIDLVVLVTYDVPDDHSEEGWRIQAYADDFFDNGGYGMGPDFSGMLYLIDLNNRAPCISTLGVMREYLNDYRIESLFDRSYSYLAYGQYGKAALSVMNGTGEYLRQGREKGTFLYDQQTGERRSGLYNPLEGFEILLAAGGGVAVAAILIASVSGAYNLKGSTYSYQVDEKSAFSLTRDDEQYLRQTVSRMARSSGSGGGRGGSGGGGRSHGSAVHRSSSGRSHGGGVGRRF